MRVKRAYIVILILSLLNVDESSPIPLRPDSAKTLLNNPFLLQKIRSLGKSFKEWNKLRSVMSSKGPIQVKERVDGISKVKDYLEVYGYLNYSSLSNSDFTDEFSTELKSAIELFQKTYNLNVTGQPDDATLSLIKLPRCAVQDVTNGTASFTKWWPEGKKELKYAFSPNDKTTPSRKDVFADAFHRWSNVTKLNFSETTSFNEADIQIMFSNWDDKLGVVGGAEVDKTTNSRKIILDSAETWMLPGKDLTESDELDLESAVMHQIGHVLGLSHTAIKEAVMYPFIVPSRKRKVDLAKDDLEKIRQLYGTKSDSSSKEKSNSPSSADNGGGVAYVGPRWDLISTLWLGIILLFWF